MKPVELIHRGRVTAAGFIIDVPTIGEREARSRVLSGLGPTDRLLLLPDGRWLMLTGAPVEADSGRAPGVALVQRGDSLVGAPQVVATGTDEILEFRFGGLAQQAVAALPAVDRTAWFDLGLVLALRPLNAPELSEPVTVEAPAAPDLRAKAGLGASPSSTNAVARELRARGGAATRPDDQRKSEGHTAGAAAPAPSRIRSALATRLMRSPAAGFVSRKHARYIEELTRQFRSGELDEALHRAIPLGSEAGAGLSLRLPQRRAQLQISTSGRAARSVPYGPTVQQHLRTLYRQAAGDLESQGSIDEAAFVLAELLRDAHACVALLERHEQFDAAARIAEQRHLDPGTIVRLWWLAKDRKRAIAVARRHGAFAAAIVRLEKVDPDAANELRIEWMAQLEQAGDLLGAVEVAWPTPSLHPLLINIVPRGEGLGGPSGGALRAYGLALEATEDRVASSLDLLRQEDDPTGELAGFLSTFATVPAASETADRRAATAYIRTNPLDAPGDVPKSDSWWKIRGRADSALVADLPAGRVPREAPTQTLRLPHLSPGQLAISDATALPSGEVLVALGPLGCKLLRRSGATAAEWNVPSSHIVLADHGGSALLLDQRPSGEVDVRRLDLTTRRLHTYGTMQLVSFSDSFDGAQWLVIDSTNAAIVDVTEASPTIVWRPLESGTACHSLLRTPLDVTALVTVSRDSVGGQDTELRTWTPTMARLTNRRVVEFPPDVSGYQLIPNGFLTQRGANVELNLPDGTDRLALETEEAAWAVGDFLVRATNLAEGRRVRVERLPSHAEVLDHVLAPGEPMLTLRAHGAFVTVWDAWGRVHALNVARMRIVSSVRAML